MKKYYLFLVLSVFLSGCGSDSVEPSKTNKAKVLADVVDDKSLVGYLDGQWGYYLDGPGQSFSNYEYKFTKGSDIMTYLIYQNKYQTLSAPEYTDFHFKIKVQNKTVLSSLYTLGSTLKPEYKKDWRFEIVSEDEMKIYLITEGISGTSEYLSGVYTKVSDLEKPVTDVVKSESLKKILSGTWKQKDTSIYKDLVFDFSAGMNYYRYRYQSTNGSNIDWKYEFKVREDGILLHRLWATTLDPSWKKYKVEVVSDSQIKLYPINNGTPASKPDFILSR